MQNKFQIERYIYFKSCEYDEFKTNGKRGFRVFLNASSKHSQKHFLLLLNVNIFFLHTTTTTTTLLLLLLIVIIIIIK